MKKDSVVIPVYNQKKFIIHNVAFSRKTIM